MADAQVAQPSILSDPNLLAIVLGMGAKAIGGPESWQGRLGAGAMGLGQSFKMAKALERRRTEEKDFWKRLFGTLGGGGEEESPMTMAPSGPGAPTHPSGFGYGTVAKSTKPPVTGFPTYRNPMLTMLGG